MHIRLLAFVIVACLTTGCGVPLNSQPVSAGGGSAASTTIDRRNANAGLPVRIFFLRDERFDWVERRDTASSSTHPEFAIRNTIESLKAGLLPREREAGFTSPLELIVADTDLTLAASVTQGVAEIDLSDASGVLRGLSVEQLKLVIAQLAVTSLLATPGIGGVQFVFEGELLRLSTQSGAIGPVLHVGDFPCLPDDLACSLPDVMLPPASPIPTDDVADGPTGSSGVTTGSQAGSQTGSQTAADTSSP